MVSFRGQKKLGPRPDWSPSGGLIQISDEHPHPFHMRNAPLPPGPDEGYRTLLTGVRLPL